MGKLWQSMLLFLLVLIFLLAGCGNKVSDRPAAENELPDINESVNMPSAATEPADPAAAAEEKTAAAGDDGEETENVERDKDSTVTSDDPVLALLQSLSMEPETYSRAGSREILLTGGVAGQDETFSFRLVNSPHMPFSTYIPGACGQSGFQLFGHGHLYGSYASITEELPPHAREIQMLRIGDSGQNISPAGAPERYLDILFFHQSTELGQARNYLRQRLEQSKTDLTLIEGQSPGWLVEAYSLNAEGNTHGGFAALGQHRDRFFLLYGAWDPQSEAKWLPTVQVILEEWRWKDDGKGAMERPNAQIYTVFTEGMEDQVLYQLVDFPGLPFTTYFPADTRLEVGNLEIGRLRGVRLGFMDIIFFPDGTTEREAELEFELVLSYLGDLQTVPADEVPAWALAKYTGWDRNTSKAAMLGEHEGRYFYIREQYSLEYGDGWSPIRSIIFAVWQWK